MDRISFERSSELYLKTEQLLHFRLAFSSASIFLAVAVWAFAKGDFEFYPIIGVIFSIILYSVLLLSLLRKKVWQKESHLQILNACILMLDVVALTAVVHVTKGVESDLFLLYLMPILLSSYTFGRRGIYCTALFVSVCYVLLLLIENASFLPYLLESASTDLTAAYAHRLWGRILARATILVIVSFVWGRFCDYMSGLAQQGANRLREQLFDNERLVAEVKAQAARESLINSINSALRSTLDISQIFATAVDELAKALRVTSCAIVCPGGITSRQPTIFESVAWLQQAGGETSNGGGNDRASGVFDILSISAPVASNRSAAADSPSAADPGTAEALPATTAVAIKLERAFYEFLLEHKSKYEKSHDGTLIKTFLFLDPAADPLFQAVKGRVLPETVASIIVQPMMYGDESRGIIVITETAADRVWTMYELELVKSVAGQVAVAIEHAELVEQLSRKNKDLLQKNLNLDAKNSELRAVQSQLIHQEKMASLGRLVAGIAHELNNPINFVHGNLPYLREYFEDLKRLIAALDDIEGLPEEHRDKVSELKTKTKYDFVVTDLDNILADLNEGAERIRHIIRNLKSFSRLDEAELKEASLKEGLESTLKILSQYYGRDKILPETDFADLPPMFCYPGQLNQVWMNLLSNAAQAVSNQAEPEVAIKTERDGDNILITIADNGPGVNPEVGSKIFEPFFTTKPVGQGTGLGLSICHSIIERHGGKIWFESAPGEGTKFRVQLPLFSKPVDLARVARSSTEDSALDPD